MCVQMGGATNMTSVNPRPPTPVKLCIFFHIDRSPPPPFTLSSFPNVSARFFGYAVAQPDAVGNEEWRSAGAGATCRDGNALAVRRRPSPTAPTARVSLASLAEPIRQIQTDRGSDALVAAIGDLREDLRTLREQLSATQEEVAAMAEGREAAIAMCKQMRLSIAGPSSSYALT